MQKDTIVFLSCVQLTAVMADSIDMPKYFQAGYKIVYLDLSEYYFPNSHIKYMSGNKNYIMSADYIVKCRDKNEILKWIKKKSKQSWFYIMHRNFDFSLEDVWLLRMLKKYKCDYIIALNIACFRPGDIIINSSMSVVKYIANNLSCEFLWSQLKSIPRKIVSYCVRNGILLQKPRYFFISGKTGEKKAKLLFPKTEVVSVPSYNYERSMNAISTLKNSSEKSIYSTPYIVYLDESVFDVPDAKLLGCTTIGRNIFFERINNFFDRLQAVTGKSIIIAASPKQKYDGDEYNGRKIVYNKTPVATYYSDMAIAHSSTAINLAVIMKKPLLLVTFKEFSDDMRKSMGIWVQALKKTPIDGEEEFNREKIEFMAMVKPELYEFYLRNYIISECSNMSVPEIIIEKLRNNGKQKP